MVQIRVALIEDDPFIRLGLREIFSGDQRFVLLGDAPDGQSGWALVKETRPDVAIVDIGLPDISGIEITQHIKSLPAQQQCRVLILTLHHSEKMVWAAFQAGADAYCLKESRPALLIAALEAVHGGAAWIDPAIARMVLPKPNLAGGISQRLTERELEVLQLIVDGYSNADIAEALYITVGTVKTHVRNILNKLCAEDRTQAAVRALRSGLVH